MLKGKSLYSNCPIYFIPNQLEPEIFMNISEVSVPNVKPYYMISNYGRVWNKYNAQFIRSSIDSKGYLYCVLATTNGPKNIRIHRLVMMNFAYFDGCENTIINHKDGIKSNCYIGNLEWSSYSENAMHAYSTGLNKKQRIDDEIVKKICHMLENNSNTLLNIAKECNVSVQIVSSIQQRRAHIDISKDYNFDLRKINSNISDDKINELCKYFENNPKKSELFVNEYIIMALNNVNLDSSNMKIFRSALRIYNKESFKHISCNYNF